MVANGVISKRAGWRHLQQMQGSVLYAIERTLHERAVRVALRFADPEADADAWCQWYALGRMALGSNHQWTEAV
jgi:hypothetical protein